MKLYYFSLWGDIVNVEEVEVEKETPKYYYICDGWCHRLPKSKIDVLDGAMSMYRLENNPCKFIHDCLAVIEDRKKRKQKEIEKLNKDIDDLNKLAEKYKDVKA